MIDTNTLFILGAGASKPYGYPTGKELRNFICKRFHNEFLNFYNFPEILYRFKDTTIKHYNGKIALFTEIFFKSSTHSIDLFLSRNPGYDEIGKMAIIAGIIDAERKSKFREDIKDEKQDWYTHLYARMTNKLTLKDSYPKFANNKVNFITFNYDRSLEHFLYESFTHSFRESQVDSQIRTSQDKSAKFAQFIPFSFLHVYGKIAPFYWEGGNPLQYGFDDKITPDQLNGNIHVIYGRQNEAVINKIKELIDWANIIFFLGFAYANENMEILGISQTILKKHHVFGTAFGTTQRERKYIMKKFRVRGSHEYNPSVLKINDMDCLALLKEYL